MSSENASRFTLWDLLILIAIIGMLLGLLLPAVNSTRGPHPRSYCVNNQSQVALALINYDSKKGALPGWRQKFKNGREASWFLPLLPYMEYNKLHEMLRAEPEKGEELTPIPVVRMRFLQCYATDGDGTETWASYIANCGKMDAEFSAVDPENPGGHVPDAVRKNGVFFDLVKTETTMSIDRIAEVKGTSNTLLVSENLQPWHWNRPPRENLLGFCSPDPSFLNQRRDVCKGAEAPVVPVFVNLCRDGDPLISYGRKPGFGEYRFARPASNHPGIVLAAFADRSVRPINEKIDPKIFEKLMVVEAIELEPDWE